MRHMDIWTWNRGIKYNDYNFISTLKKGRFLKMNNTQEKMNPVLSRIIKEESAVKKIIYNTIINRNVHGSTFIDVDDVYQDICLLAMNSEKIQRRANKLNTHFYGSIKMFAIDCVLKEQRRLNRFRMTKIEGLTHNKKLSHPNFATVSENWLTIREVLTPDEFEIFTLYYSGFTIAEISKKIGKACQYAITKIKQKLADELYA